MKKSRTLVTCTLATLAVALVLVVGSLVVAPTAVQGAETGITPTATEQEPTPESPTTTPETPTVEATPTQPQDSPPDDPPDQATPVPTPMPDIPLLPESGGNLGVIVAGATLVALAAGGWVARARRR